MIIKMSVEDLFEAMKTLKPGERIDIASHENEVTGEAEGWSGILCIDASVFCEDKAWFIDYYGGQSPHAVAYGRDDSYDEECALESLRDYLKSYDILCEPYNEDPYVLVDGDEAPRIYTGNEG